MTKIDGIKIRLRDFALGDLGPYAMWQVGNHEWKKFDAPYYHSSNVNFTKVTKSLEEQIEIAPPQEPRSRLVIADPSTDDLIGTVNTYWISKETNWLAAGIVIYNPKFWDSGIGREALAMWIHYQFQNRPEIVRLDLQTWSGNARMMALAEKLGFTMEGRFKNARIVMGQHFDSIHYGIQRSDWTERASNQSNSGVAPS